MLNRINAFISRHIQLLMSIELFALILLRPMISPKLGASLFLSIVIIFIWSNSEVRGSLKKPLISIFFILLVTSFLIRLDITSERLVFHKVLIACLFFCIFFIIKSLLKSKTISESEVLGLVNCYIIIGIIWAYVYEIYYIYVPNSFLVTYPDKESISNFVYFSFVTLTTIGYGDIVPRNEMVQRLAVVEAIIGQFYISIVVAYILSRYIHIKHYKK